MRGYEINDMKSLICPTDDRRQAHLEFCSGSQLYFVPQFQLHQDLHCTGMDMDSVRCKHILTVSFSILFLNISRLRTISLPVMANDTINDSH